MTKLKKSNCDKLENSNCEQNSKTQIVTQLNNSNSGKT